jgi:riboflavin kinase/FMN adenylyltransferase
MIVDRLRFLDDSPNRQLDDVRYSAAIGSFDGVHRGHQYLLGRLIDEARSETGTHVEYVRQDNDAVARPYEPNPLMDPAGVFRPADEVASGATATGSLVVTFDPLPFELFNPEAAPGRLTDIPERLEVLAGLGIDRVCVVEFTRGVASLPAAKFLRRLTARYAISTLWCGDDFAFGHNREGTVDFLRTHASEFGMHIAVVERIDLGGSALGSREIRRLVAAGEIEAATNLLGHLPTVSGTVVRGAQRGRLLGFPTANLDLPPFKLTPEPGVYAGYARIDGEDKSHHAAISVGHNPTFGANPLTVEAHILDFDRDIYDRRLKVTFAHRLRDELTFESVDALVVQMGRDVAETRARLEG